MRTYHKTTVLVGGILPINVETWTEHNHSTVYSDGNEIFDGYKCEAYMVVKEEIKRLIDNAERMGLTAEIQSK